MAQADLTINVSIIEDGCIQSLTLYDADGNAVGESESYATDVWQCEVTKSPRRYSKTCQSLRDALAYLKFKRDELFPGGEIVAFAEFTIDPNPIEATNGNAIDPGGSGSA